MRIARWLGVIRVELVSRRVSKFTSRNFSTQQRTAFAGSPCTNMASPAPPEVTTIDGKKYRQVREGLASVLAPYAEENSASLKGNKNNEDGNQALSSAKHNKNNEEG